MAAENCASLLANLPCSTLASELHHCLDERGHICMKAHKDAATGVGGVVAYSGLAAGPSCHRQLHARLLLQQHRVTELSCITTATRMKRRC
jgi:hypothetical protein